MWRKPPPPVSYLLRKSSDPGLSNNLWSLPYLQIIEHHVNPVTGRAWKAGFLLPQAQCGGEAGPPSDYTMAVYSYNGEYPQLHFNILFIPLILILKTVEKREPGTFCLSSSGHHVQSTRLCVNSVLIPQTPPFVSPNQLGMRFSSSIPPNLKLYFFFKQTCAVKFLGSDFLTRSHVTFHCF